MQMKEDFNLINALKENPFEKEIKVGTDLYNIKMMLI